MANSIKKQQNKQLKKYASNRVKSINKTLKPRMYGPGSLPSARRTVIEYTVNKTGNDVTPIKPVQLKKMRKTRGKNRRRK